MLESARYCETPFTRGTLAQSSASIAVEVRENTGLEHDWSADLSAVDGQTTRVQLYSFSVPERRELAERFRRVVQTGDFRQCKAVN